MGNSEEFGIAQITAMLTKLTDPGSPAGQN